MFAFIVGVGCFFIKQEALGLGAGHVVAGIAVTFLSTKTFMDCALADPGVFPPNPVHLANTDKRSNMQLLPSSGRRNCRDCGIVQPQGCMHCEFCNVCIDGWDHHCPWMNK